MTPIKAREVKQFPQRRVPVPAPLAVKIARLKKYVKETTVQPTTTTPKNRQAPCLHKLINPMLLPSNNDNQETPEMVEETTHRWAVLHLSRGNRCCYPPVLRCWNHLKSNISLHLLRSTCSIKSSWMQSSIKTLRLRPCWRLSAKPCYRCRAKWWAWVNHSKSE